MTLCGEKCKFANIVFFILLDLDYSGGAFLCLFMYHVGLIHVIVKGQ